MKIKVIAQKYVFESFSLNPFLFRKLIHFDDRIIIDNEGYQLLYFSNVKYNHSNKLLDFNYEGIAKSILIDDNCDSEIKILHESLTKGLEIKRYNNKIFVDKIYLIGLLLILASVLIVLAKLKALKP